MEIINDTIREDTESFFLDLTTPVMLDRVTINPAVTEVIINDDDRESSRDVMLAIDHGTWQIYLQRFDYTLIIFFRQLWQFQLPEEDYQSIIETLKIKFCQLP